ncbi:cytochrome C5 [Herbiconiux sp. KACC 21604]|uniref:cytochrome C5 n=1 Tax=unclassified Herbiconiux TaxID=2618217 RepID=UPI0014928A1F|nr:cytochrome C5 [Herbiconiux sp. SALV-R1]QJU55600.1 cytochrome C5 [Herbiconiux sp. SALV-R1]WPO86796.1 cytochrome C5 [Herbiconiux sp. KACC 21604]
MTADVLDDLHRLLDESGLLREQAVENGIVHGRAAFAAAGVDVAVNVDPELDDEDDERDPDAQADAATETDASAADDADAGLDPDPAALVASLARLLALDPAAWRTLVDTIAEEIEEAVGDDEVEEQTDLRDDLTLTSIVVFADATVFAFTAPHQFPSSRLLAQFDADLDIEHLEVLPLDDDAELPDADPTLEVRSFGTLEALLTHISVDEEPETP